MTASVYLKSGGGRKVTALVTDIGQLVTAPFSYDDVRFNELAEDDIAYNFAAPISGRRFVITGIYFRADKQVSSTVDAAVIVYEATAIDTTTVAKVLFQFAVVQGDIINVGGLNIIANEGVWINAKTSDDDIHMTITGYHIPV